VAAPFPPEAWALGLPRDWFIVAPADGQVLHRVIGRSVAAPRDFASNERKQRRRPAR